MVTFCLLLSLSSCLFELKQVNFVFFGDYGQVVNNTTTRHFSTSSQMDKVRNSASFDYGTSLFLLSKQKYIDELEVNNPYLEVVSMEAVFPNAMLVKVKERQPLFFMNNNSTNCILDKDFKILESSNDIDISTLIEIKFLSQNNTFLSYYDFFEISSFAYDNGQFLQEDNLVFQSIAKIFYYFSAYESDFVQKVKSLVVVENQTTANLQILTSSPYGITLFLENVLKNFNSKLQKLLDALFTLRKNESIKTTYGVLKIDNHQNCYWNNL